MNVSTQIYNNPDIFRIIISYNTCSFCKSVFDDDTKKFINNFHNIYNIIEKRWYKGLCKNCMKSNKHDNYIYWEK